MVIDGLPEGGRLSWREGDGDGPGFDFARPAPGAGMVFADAALAQPIQGEDGLFATLKAGAQGGGLTVRKRWFFHQKKLGGNRAYIYALSMRSATPFFAAFGPLLFGKPKKSALQRLLQQDRPARSLNQLQEAFGHLIPTALLAANSSGMNSRERIFPPLVTFWAFLAQVLERGSSCRAALLRVLAWAKFEGRARETASSQTGGYCQARARLEDHSLQGIGTHLAEQLERNTPAGHLWKGRAVKIVDGTGVSMPDTPANQQPWPQSKEQQPGCGFPWLKLVGLFDLASGAFLHFVHGNKHQHEATLARALWPLLQAGDILLADRGFCSFASLHAILAQGADAVLRLHQARPADFRRGRRLGRDERLLTWVKPLQCPKTWDPQDFAALPATLTLRLLRYRIAIPGFRSQQVVLVTTLLDPELYPGEDLAELYFQRWSVELHFREIKTLLGMDVLRCLSPKMILKELAMHRIAYNLVRALMQQASLQYHVALPRLSFKGTLDALDHFAQTIHAATGQPRKQAALLAALLSTIAADLLPSRPGRSEPRAKKRRPKNYHLLTKPRKLMRLPSHRNRPKWS